MPISELQKQEIIELREWIKSHPEFQEIMKQQVQPRLLMMKSKFQVYGLSHQVIAKIVEYGNEEFLMGYYLRDTREINGG